MNTKIIVRYWTKDTWPYSIDNKPEDAEKAILEVDTSETFFHEGKRYYRLVSGHGCYTDLLIKDG